MLSVSIGSKRPVVGGSKAQRKKMTHRSHQRNRSMTNDQELQGVTIDDDELALPIRKTREEFQSSIDLITSNKLNGINSWEVPIIEYFHDMNLLRGEDGSINFQTASTTLDGCTRIMSKRVDLVVGDANSLLTLMQVKKRNDKVDDEEDPDDPNFHPTKAKQRARKVDVLDSFSRLKITDQQLERVNIDPVFRKMVAEFDEGGTKSLLLNTLRISTEGKVMLDDAIPTGSEDVVNVYGEEEDDDRFGVEQSFIKRNPDDDESGDTKMEYDDEKDNDEEFKDVSGALLSNFKLTVQLIDIENSSLIPSMGKLREYMENDDNGKSFIGGLNGNLEIKDNDEDDDMPEYHVEYDYDVDDFELGRDENPDVNISEDTNLDVSRRNDNDVPDYDNFDMLADEMGMNNDVVRMDNVERKMQNEVNLMEALDRKMGQRLNRSHWKIRAINTKPQLFNFGQDDVAADSAGVDGDDADSGRGKKGKVVKVSKTAYVIDFMSGDADIRGMFEKSSNEETRKDKSVVHVDETTLPDLKSWQAGRLTECSIQPKRTLHNIFTRSDHTLDRSYWAEQYNDKNNDSLAYTVPGYEQELDEGEGGVGGDNDDDVDFGDMDAGMYDFDAIPDNDAPIVDLKRSDSGRVELPKVEIIKANRARSKDTIHYERRVKRINVRLLKKNLWDVTKEQTAVNGGVEDVPLSSIVRDTYDLYEGREKEDLSTSFFFICMLHIANEEGLSIDSTEDMQDLIIHKN